MRVISFALYGRFAHFARAESSTTVLSYPVPPRTVVMGLVGAILGIQKDQPQIMIEPMKVAISGRIPLSHWHKAKLRKDPPELLSSVVKRNQNQDKTTKPEKATLVMQEWLFNPRYQVWVSLPEPFQTQLELRIKERRWYFQPSLGLSEMLADMECLECFNCSDEELPEGMYNVSSVVKQDNVKLDFGKLYDNNLAVQLLRMPRSVDSKRVFKHATYAVEQEGKPLPVRTGHAFQVGDRVVMFL